MFSFYTTALTVIDYCLIHGHVPIFDYDLFSYRAPGTKDPWANFFEPLELYSSPYKIKGKLDIVFNHYPPYRCKSDPSYMPLVSIWNGQPEDRETRESLHKFSKHIRIRQDIIDIADKYAEEHFKGKTVTGVHIRHTDHWKDGLLYLKKGYSYHPLEEYIQELEKHTDSDFIFVATDSQKNIGKLKFIKDLRKRIIYRDVDRSPNQDCVHLNASEFNFDPIKLGVDVLIDALIMARCNKLVGAYSNITLAVLFWNPSLPYINIAQMAERQTR